MSCACVSAAYFCTQPVTDVTSFAFSPWHGSDLDYIIVCI